MTHLVISGGSFVVVHNITADGRFPCLKGQSVRRRDFIQGIAGSAVAWPLAARAQQPAMPVVGFINGGSADSLARYVAAFRKGLNETGYVEGQNVTVEYHWLEGQYDRLPALMADLVRRQVAVIATPGHARCARGQSCNSDDPDRLRCSAKTRSSLVLSPASPGPAATRPASIFSPPRWWPSGCGSCMTWCPRPFVLPCSSIRPMLRPPKSTLRDVQEAAPAIGLQIQILNATTIGEIDAAFAAFARERPDALFVAPDGFFISRAVQFATLTARDRIPATYAQRDFVAAGGLMSYGTDLADTFHQVGVYTGSILKGAKPADLPVLQSTKFEFVINLQTARALGIEVPPAVLSIADEVIE